MFITTDFNIKNYQIILPRPIGPVGPFYCFMGVTTGSAWKKATLLDNTVQARRQLSNLSTVSMTSSKTYRLTQMKCKNVIYFVVKKQTLHV